MEIESYHYIPMTTYKDRGGQPIKILNELGSQRNPYQRMFAVEFEDGFQLAVFEDEIEGLDIRLITNWNALAETCHEYATSRGFWREQDIRDKPEFVAEKLMLIVTEVSEAMEALRDGKTEDIADELCDTMIRALDLAAAMKLDLNAAMKRVIDKAQSRPHLHGRKL